MGDHGFVAQQAIFVLLKAQARPPHQTLTELPLIIRVLQPQGVERLVASVETLLENVVKLGTGGARQHTAKTHTEELHQLLDNHPADAQHLEAVGQPVGERPFPAEPALSELRDPKEDAELQAVSPRLHVPLGAPGLRAVAQPAGLGQQERHRAPRDGLVRVVRPVQLLLARRQGDQADPALVRKVQRQNPGGRRLGLSGPVAGADVFGDGLKVIIAPDRRDLVGDGIERQGQRPVAQYPVCRRQLVKAQPADQHAQCGRLNQQGEKHKPRGEYGDKPPYFGRKLVELRRRQGQGQGHRTPQTSPQDHRLVGAVDALRDARRRQRREQRVQDPCPRNNGS